MSKAGDLLKLINEATPNWKKDLEKYGLVLLDKKTFIPALLFDVESYKKNKDKIEKYIEKAGYEVSSSLNTTLLMDNEKKTFTKVTLNLPDDDDDKEQPYEDRVKDALSTLKTYRGGKTNGAIVKKVAIDYDLDPKDLLKRLNITK